MVFAFKFRGGNRPRLELGNISPISNDSVDSFYNTNISKAQGSHLPLSGEYTKHLHLSFVFHKCRAMLEGPFGF